MRLLLLFTLSVLATSCSDVSSSVRNFTPPKLKNLLSGEKDIQVVQVRPEALKEVTDSREKALAYFKNRQTRQNAAALQSLKPLDLPAAGSDFQGLPSRGIRPPLDSGSPTELPTELPPINFDEE